MGLFEDFVNFVKARQGQTLTTVGGRSSFKVTVTEDGFTYMPLSTKKLRKQTYQYAKMVFDQHIKTHSIAPSDYSEITRNSSYVLALIHSFYSERLPGDSGADIGGETALEGMTKERRYLSKVRNKWLAEERKRQDGYKCQACGFDTMISGRSVVECHHLNPVASGGTRITGIAELVTLCPTCHRLAHLQDPPFSVSDLQKHLCKPEAL